MEKQLKGDQTVADHTAIFLYGRQRMYIELQFNIHHLSFVSRLHLHSLALKLTSAASRQQLLFLGC